MSNSNLIRMTGMSSGLDVDSIVDAMIKSESYKVDKAKQEQQRLEWKQGDYRDIITSINDFKSKYLNYANPSTNMLSSTAFVSYDVKSSDTYNTYIKAAGSGNAAVGNYIINDITVATKTSYNGVSSLGIESTSQKVSSLFSNDADAIVSFKINDTEFTYDFSSTGADKDKSIGTLMNEISNKAGVTLKYNQLADRFSLESASTGEGQRLELSETSGKLFATLFGEGATLKQGTNATVTIKDPTGASNIVTRSTNTFSIDGVSYNLISDNHTAEGITISLSDNVDEVYGKINNFINDYNTLIDKIYNKINEKPDSGYPPLTDDQKEGMEEKEIEKWEEKAKKGLIKGDSTLQNLLNNLRSSLYTAVDAAGMTLTEIGLSTSSDYTKHGKIELDETKLKSALKNNKDAVISIFTNVSATQPSYSATASTESQKARKKEEGIFHRISDILLDNVRTTGMKEAVRATC
jgi:flagellar hook-associated protein 2